MSNIDKQALNQEKIEWLNKLADMEYCKSNPGHWLMSLKDTNMLAKLALRSVALLDELEAAEKRIAELEARQVLLPPKAPDNLASCLDGYEKWLIATTFRDTWNACLAEVVRVNAAAGKGE
ncbi:ead/Ea22-like family protein [Enterobacter asburiae]|uniref:ead/Ea22-like family protein n=1 Tax=Enterobacter asburiae TaxID=61645 RepID=UPI00210F0438|nr:ead/Ea22-like family protein [Enterobacter asburiae]